MDIEWVILEHLHWPKIEQDINVTIHNAMQNTSLAAINLLSNHNKIDIVQ